MRNNRKVKRLKKIPANEFSQEEVELFLSTIKQSNEYIKIRDLKKIFRNKLDLFKINSILKYLERSKIIEIDLDGNIIWIKNNIDRQLTFWEKASTTNDFKELFNKKILDQNQFET